MMRPKNWPLCLITSLLLSSDVQGVIAPVTNPDIEGLGGLREAIELVNSTGDSTNEINIAPAILIGPTTYNLPPIEINGGSLTINGPIGDTIFNGANQFRGLFISSGNVTVNRMQFTNVRAIGGAGGASSAGGGLGAGGAFFVKSPNTLTLDTVTITSANARGGNGANAVEGVPAGGGGGMGGQGGQGGDSSAAGGGGGGLFGNGADGGSEGGGAGGGGLFGNGGLPGGTTFPDSSGGGGGGGGSGIPFLPVDGQAGASGIGGNGANAVAPNGRGGLNSGNPFDNGEDGGLYPTINIGGGGGVGGSVSVGHGGMGGYNGGGGGGGASSVGGIISGGDGGEYGGGGSGGIFSVLGTTSVGGKGGFGGGGGAGAVGGAGGFGGGAGANRGAGVGAQGGYGGGGSGGVPGGGDFPGGSGGPFGGQGGSGSQNGRGGGGGGAGLGGALFIYKGATTVIHDGISFTDSSVTGGSGGAGSGCSFGGSSGQALGVDIFMMADAQLTFDLSGTFEISSDIIGDGGAGGGSTTTHGVTKIGPGTVTLGGANTYTGVTNVTAGTLVINGSIITPTIVDTGSTLKGFGTIFNSVEIFNGATIDPGKSTSVLHVDSLVLNPLSQTIIDADILGAAAMIDVVGNATINGILQMNFGSGSYADGEIFTIVETGGDLTGQFSSTQTSLGVVYQTIYNPKSIQIVIGPVIPPPIPPPPFLLPCTSCSLWPTLALQGIRDNARRTGNYLNSINIQPFIQSELTSLEALSSLELSEALESISPGRNAISTYVSQDAMFLINKVATTRMSAQRSLRSLGNRNPTLAYLWQEASEELLADASEDNRLPKGSTLKAGAGNEQHVIWATGLKEYAHQEAQRQNPAFDFTIEGGLVGFETYQFSHILLGVTGGYAHSHSEMDNKAGCTQANTYFVGLYETTYVGNGYFEFSLLGTYNFFKNQRHIVYPGFDATAHSSHTGWQLTPMIALGYDFGFKWGIIEPFGTVEAVLNTERAFSEKKASVYNMRQQEKTSELLRAEVGANIYETWNKEWGAIILRETVSYVLRKPYGVGTVTASIIGAPGQFTVYSLTETQSIVAPGAELFFKHKNGGFASMTYSGEFSFGTGYTSNEIIGKIGVYF